MAKGQKKCYTSDCKLKLLKKYHFVISTVAKRNGEISKLMKLSYF